MATKRKEVSYTNDDFEERRGEVEEKNGNLSWVVDKETGEGSYRAPHEVKDW